MKAETPGLNHGQNAEIEFLPRVSRLSTHYATWYTEYRIDVILKEILMGVTTVADCHEGVKDKTLAGVTAYAREMLGRGNEQAYAIIKQGMPAFAPAGVFETGRKLVKPSGLVCLDYDSIDDIGYALSLVEKNPYTFAAWRSLRGSRLKLLVRVSAYLPNTYAHAWYACSESFWEIGEADPSGRKPSALCALVYDPNVYINFEAESLDWVSVFEAEPYQESFGPTDKVEAKLLSQLPDSIRDLLPQLDFNPDGWATERVPCPWGHHEHDGLNLRSNATRIRQTENSIVVECFKCPRREVYQSKLPIHTPPEPIIESSDDPRFEKMVADAPMPEVYEQASYQHFFREAQQVVRDVLHEDPDAGWNGPTPIWTPKFEYLYPLTQQFSPNGEPPEVETQRVWNTQFTTCHICGGIAAKWINVFFLTAGCYCANCGADYQLGSYLQRELHRKLNGAIVSDFQGFLGNDPAFRDLSFFRRGLLTYLGAAMGTGKTTEIAKILRDLRDFGVGIIAVPRIALAQFLAYQLRRLDGHRAWGLWHDGTLSSDKFIGDIGVICVLPSLPRVIATIQEELPDTRIHLALDELDFSETLLLLVREQATAVRKCIQDCLDAWGLVVLGQTETTLGLEALISLLQPSNVQSFYNTAPPAEGTVTLHHLPECQGKQLHLLVDAIETIQAHLNAGYNVYVFVTLRREGDIIARIFAREDPVVYSSLSRNSRRCQQILWNQKLTDSRLFIGTSSAGVGISISDPKARTVVVSGSLYGLRNTTMETQECFRDRGRRGIDYGYTDYNFMLPTVPSHLENFSLFHEACKQQIYPDAHISKPVVRRIARAKGLALLANFQPSDVLDYHLGTVGNMPIKRTQIAKTDPDKVQNLREIKRDLIDTEKTQKYQGAVDLLSTRIKDPNVKLFGAYTIRTNRYMSIEERLAAQYVRDIAVACGAKEEFVPELHAEILLLSDQLVELALHCCENQLATDALETQRRGYLSVHYREVVVSQLKTELLLTDKEWVDQGHGLESHSVKDDRMVGDILQALLTRLQGKAFTLPELADAILETLKTNALLTPLQNGAAGEREAQFARSLHIRDDERVKRWTEGFLSQWYGARIAKRGDFYGLKMIRHFDLCTEVFQSWLTAQSAKPINVGNITRFIEAELPAPNAEERTLARQYKQNGAWLKEIATVFKVSPSTVSRWCKGTQSVKDAKKAEAIKLETLGVPREDIAQQLVLPHETIGRWLKVTSLHLHGNSNYKNTSTRNFSTNGDVSDVTLEAQILALLAAGEKQTGKIIKALPEFSERHIKRELKRLVEAEKIRKARHGHYEIIGD